MSKWNPDRGGPLVGLSVLELGAGVAAPFCAKLLGDLGADVIKLEDPIRGDPARWRGPTFDGSEDPERSGTFLYLNTSKRSVRLDLENEVGRDRFRDLATRVDVLIEDRPPGTLESVGLGATALIDANPRLIVTSITPFGQTGPNRLHRSQPLNLYHSSGHASPFAVVGAGQRAPSRAGGPLGEYDAGLTAALGILGALFGRSESGRGGHIDVSKQEAMMCLERVTIGRYANEPAPFTGRGGPGGLTRAKDGYVMLTTLEAHQWAGLMRVMGNPEWSAAEWCRTPAGRMEHLQEIEAHKNAWAATRTRSEIYHAAQAEGTPAAPVHDLAEVLAWAQPRSRGFFREIEHPRAGRLMLPTAPYVFSKTPWVGTRAPLLGEHDADLSVAPSGARSGGGRTQKVTRTDAPSGPLAGIRIADFTWAWAGPQGSLLLGMLGAEVIKIESRSRLDHSRVHSLTAGSLQGGIDESPVFNDLNLGKRSVTLNLRNAEGRSLARQLVARCDVALQNMRPGVLDRLGLGYESLCAIRPDLVMLSSSAVGATGPEGHYAGYAPTFACLSGIASVSGHPDEPPLALSGSVDLRVGTASALAVLAALLHRARTGEGQHIDLSSSEVMSAMLGHAFLDYGLSGRIPARIGNRDEIMAPHGCYRSAIAPGSGEWGEWVTIAVADDLEWQALRTVIGDPELDATRFATRAARKQHEDLLDERIERWTASRSAEEIVARLQAAGVAAARVQSGASLSRDPHVAARGVFEEVDHPRMGRLRVVRPPWRMHGARVPGPAPLLGQHNDYVLGEILGLDPAEIERLVAAEAVY